MTVFICCMQRLIVVLRQNLYIHNIRDMKVCCIRGRGGVSGGRGGEGFGGWSLGLLLGRDGGGGGEEKIGLINVQMVWSLTL